MFGPLVVLLGELAADESDDGVAVGEMPTTSVRRRISRLRRSCGLLNPILAPYISRIARPGSQDAGLMIRARLVCWLGVIP